MKKFATIAALCAVGSLTHATPLAQSGPQEPVSLKEVVKTIQTAGIQSTVPEPTNLPPPTPGAGNAYTYCQATPNSFGTVASIGYVGSLELTESTFGLTTSGVSPIPQSWGMFTYGSVPTNTPFANGYLCISPFNPGIYKMETQSLGTGFVTKMIASSPKEFTLIQPGSSWNFQFWYRDPSMAPARFNLSNALHVDFAP